MVKTLRHLVSSELECLHDFRDLSISGKEFSSLLHSMLYDIFRVAVVGLFLGFLARHLILDLEDADLLPKPEETLLLFEY